MKIHKKYYDLDILEIILDSYDELEENNEERIRVSISSEKNNMIGMINKGYVMVDRTILTSINLLKSDFDKNIRMEVKKSEEYRDEITDIALNNFKNDYRFNLEFDNTDVSRKIIKGYVDEIKDAFICFYKEKPIGFIQCCNFEDKEDTAFINLAAIDEKYRATGAAVSLYSYVAKYYKDKGYKILNGRISTKNMSVMNLYSFLGAKFSKPYDIYIKR